MESRDRARQGITVRLDLKRKKKSLPVQVTTQLQARLHRLLVTQVLMLQTTQLLLALPVLLAITVQVLETLACLQIVLLAISAQLAPQHLPNA